MVSRNLGWLWVGALLLLPGCASYPRAAMEPRPEVAVESIAEPGPTEVVVVHNGNAFLGRHSGIFVGTRLTDPSGSYRVKRPQGPTGGQATLQDYVRYQLQDGPLVNLYRFTLSPEEFAVVAARQERAGLTPPLFCAAGVQHLIAGVGPFRNLPEVWWTTPSTLKESLAPLTVGSAPRGLCTWANGQPCAGEPPDRTLTLQQSGGPSSAATEVR